MIDLETYHPVAIAHLPREGYERENARYLEDLKLQLDERLAEKWVVFIDSDDIAATGELTLRGQVIAA
jgi:hypothetical protein